MMQKCTFMSFVDYKIFNNPNEHRTKPSTHSYQSPRLYNNTVIRVVERLGKCLYARLYDTHSSQRDKTNPFPCVAVSSINVAAAALASSPSIKAESSQRRVVNARAQKNMIFFRSPLFVLLGDEMR